MNSNLTPPLLLYLDEIWFSDVCDNNLDESDLSQHLSDWCWTQIVLASLILTPSSQVIYGSLPKVLRPLKARKGPQGQSQAVAQSTCANPSYFWLKYKSMNFRILGQKHQEDIWHCLFDKEKRSKSNSEAFNLMPQCVAKKARYRALLWLKFNLWYKRHNYSNVFVHLPLTFWIIIPFFLSFCKNLFLHLEETKEGKLQKKRKSVLLWLCSSYSMYSQILNVALLKW